MEGEATGTLARMRRLSAHRALGVVAVLVGAFALWSRFVSIDGSLWLDEAYTARHFVARGPDRIFSSTAFLPNNHVFFSLIEWATTRILGTSDRVLRLWSVVPALAAIALIVQWCRRELGLVCGLVAGSLLVMSPLHFTLSVQARGYGIGFLASALLIITGVRVTRSGDRLSWLAMGASALLAIWTLPQMAFVYGGHLLVLVWRRDRIRGVLLNGVAVSLLTVAFYRGLVSNFVGQATRVGSRAGDQVGWWDIIDDPAQFLFAPWLTLPGRESSGWFIAISFVALMALGIWMLVKRKQFVVLAHLTLPWLTFMLALMLLGSSTLERYISFLIIPISVLIAVGLSDGLAALVPSRAARLAVGLGVLAALTVVGLGAVNEWAEPFENYSDAVDLAQTLGIEDMATNRFIGSAGFLWYDESIERVEDVATLCERDTPTVLLDFPFRPVDLPACISEQATTRLEVPQRREPEKIVVWVVSPR